MSFGVLKTLTPSFRRSGNKNFRGPEKSTTSGRSGRDVANRIKSELKYPGEIKVNVIREIRAVEYAK